MMAVWDGLKSEPVRRLERASGEALVGRFVIQTLLQHVVATFISEFQVYHDDLMQICMKIENPHFEVLTYLELTVLQSTSSVRIY